MVSSMETDPPAPGFSSAKRSVLLLLKRTSVVSVAAVARALGISRAAAWKHLASLEAAGWVEREYRRGPRGRPAAAFRLAARSRPLFPQAYTEMSLGALAFLERRDGRIAVREMLEERGAALGAKHAPRLDRPDLFERVRELAKIRDEEGYMASASRAGRSGFELLEHNCPILAVAERYGEACEVERRLFQRLLRAEVAVSHRVVAGDPVCRFRIGRPPAAAPP